MNFKFHVIPICIVIASFSRFTSTLNEPYLNRTDVISSFFTQVSGIYSDIQRVAKYKTQSTVLVAVVSLNLSNQRNNKYRLMLINWLCFISHYNLKAAIYIVPERNITFEDQTRTLRSFGINNTFLPYPTDLFWSVLKQKTSKVHMGHNRCKYSGDVPSMDTYGGIVKIIPLLEVLQLGYSFVFLDIDVALIHDIIPSIIKGSADINFSLEMRNCFYPSKSTHFEHVKWPKLEPNSGVMFVRSKLSTIIFFKRWIQALIESNYCPEQKVLVPMELHATYDFSCNSYMHSYSGDINKLVESAWKYNKPTLRRSKENSSLNINGPNATFCFLNELEFQNGKVALHCSRGQLSSRAEYFVTTYEQAFAADYAVVYSDNGSSSKTTTGYPVDLIPDSALLEKDLKRRKNSTVGYLMSPKLIHVNYCDEKIFELKGIGLWLVNEYKLKDPNARCKSYDYKKSIYGKVSDWNEKIIQDYKRLQDIHDKLRNGTLLRHPDANFVIYLVADGKLREIPDMDTFVKMGFKMSDVVGLGYSNILSLMQFGPMLPSLAFQNLTKDSIK